MNYIGSKRKLADSIKLEISSRISSGIFCDLFAGTGAISEKFTDYSLLVNDWEEYSYCINLQKFSSYKPSAELLKERLTHFNCVTPIKGFIWEHYSLGGSDRMYFTEENAAIIDAIRCEIEEVCSEEEKLYFIALLLEAADKVANVASVYGAYLKNFKDSAKKTLVLKDLEKYSTTGIVYNSDANTLDVSGDILYLDPPYNTRHYGANYHILNTIFSYEEFTPKGKTGLPEYKKSPYCSKVKIKDAFESLIDRAQFKHIFISYNNEGILSESDFIDICKKYGNLEIIILNDSYQRFKADSNRSQKADTTIEYLYYLEKTS